MQVDPRFLEGIKLFNERKFFESHEVLEDLWREEVDKPKKFYQGLIQAAVALHHYLNKNWRGAVTEYYFTQESLEKYRPSYMGVDIESLLYNLELVFSGVIDNQIIEPRLELIPTINLAERQE